MHDRAWMIGVGIMLLLLSGMVVGIGMWNSRPVEVKLVGKSWERSIPIMEWQRVQGEGWTVPADATEIAHWQKYRTTQTYPCGDDTCTEEVYAPWYTWEANRWVEVQRHRTQGTHREDPYWSAAASDFHPGPEGVYGSQREGTRTSTLWFHFTSVVDGRTYTVQVTNALYQDGSIGRTYVLNRNWLGRITEIGSAPPR